MEHGDVSLVTFLIPGQRVTPEYKDADAEALAKNYGFCNPSQERLLANKIS